MGVIEITVLLPFRYVDSKGLTRLGYKSGKVQIPLEANEIFGGSEVNDLKEARRWVWAKLAKRAGVAPKHELDAIWDDDPQLLDDALRSMRDDGIISHTNGYWFLRESL